MAEASGVVAEWDRVRRIMSTPDSIFVFGSNEAGIHGAGAALEARTHYGAVPGQEVHLMGRCYAIPTKDKRLCPLPLSEIRLYVREFVKFARTRPDLCFAVTRVGCGLAGYRDAQMAPMFAGYPSNVYLPPSWVDILQRGKR